MCLVELWLKWLASYTLSYSRNEFSTLGSLQVLNEKIPSTWCSTSDVRSSKRTHLHWNLNLDFSFSQAYHMHLKVTIVIESNYNNFSSVPFVCSTYSSASDICCKVVKSFMLVSDATLKLPSYRSRLNLTKTICSLELCIVTRIASFILNSILLNLSW